MPEIKHIVMSSGGIGAWVDLCNHLLLAATEDVQVVVLLRYEALDVYLAGIEQAPETRFWTQERAHRWCQTQGIDTLMDALGQAIELCPTRLLACSTTLQVLGYQGSLPADVEVAGSTGFIAEAGGAVDCIWIDSVD